MKRFLSVAFAVLMIAGLSACKKDYTCECSDGSEATYPNVTKKQAEDGCQSTEDGLNAFGANVTCELK